MGRAGRAHRRHVAVDLGAGSGRVLVGGFGDEALFLQEVHRFANPVQTVAGRQRWNTEHLFTSIVAGLGKAASVVRDVSDLVSVGVDTWGVDYGLLDAEGRLLEEPVCYRDPRTDGVMEQVFQRVFRDEIYARTGIQFLPFNTLYQLVAQRALGEWPERAARFLMMPDLLHHRLMGGRADRAHRGEFTDATTTQLVNARSRTWDDELFAMLDLDPSLMPELVQPGTALGRLDPSVARTVGLPGLKVVAPATHDTASAVVATPLEPGWLYLSSGTWSLLGAETAEPVIHETTARHGFTNEGGAFGTNRLLRNVMGLWILESCRKEWAAAGTDLDHEALAARIQRAPRFAAWIDPDDLRFLNPGSMTRALTDYLGETGQSAVEEPGALARVILESLALRYAEVVDRLREVGGVEVRGIHVVGGGSRNAFLNQATADATGLTVRAGPTEATALGNLIVQAVADGRFSGLEEARAFVRAHASITAFEPQQDAAWSEARRRFSENIERGQRPRGG